MNKRLLKSALLSAWTLGLVHGAHAQMLQTLIGSPNNRNELVTCVKALPDGSAVMGGYIYDIVSGQPVNLDMLLLRVRTDGSIVWQKQIGASGGGDDLMNNLIVTQNNEIVAVGTVGRSGAYTNNTAAIYRFDTSGTLLWQRYVRITPGAGNAGEVLSDVAELANGNLIAIGSQDAAPSISKSMICSFTAGGALNYIESRDRSSSDAYLGICPVGNDVIITGWWDGATYKDTRIMRYTPGATSGTVVWDKSYNITGSMNSFGTVMGSDALVRVYVRGGKVVAGGGSSETWSNSPSIQTAFECDLATGNNAKIRGMLSKTYSHANNTAIYPVDSATYYVAQNPATSFQDAVLWTAPIFTNALISKVRPFNTSGQVLASREFNLAGSQSIFSMDMFANALFMAGCSNSGTTTINNDIYFVLSMSSLTNPNASCDLVDDSMDVTAPILVAQTPSETIVHPVNTGTFSVTFSNPNLTSHKACGEIFSLAKQTGIAGVQADHGFTLYPNPATDNITLELKGGRPAGTAEVLVMNAAGQLVQSTTAHFNASGRSEIKTAGLPAGSYFLRLSSADGMIGVRAFIVSR